MNGGLRRCGRLLKDGSISAFPSYPHSFLPRPCPLVGYTRPANMRSIICLLSFLLLAGQGQFLVPETGPIVELCTSQRLR